MSKLIYCATPSRIVHKIQDIMDHVTKKKLGPLHPFQAFPYERFEGGPISRDKTMEFCLRLVEVCDEFWMFGVSKGTLQELVHAQKIGKPVVIKFRGFDPEWRKFYQELGSAYANPLGLLPDLTPEVI